MYIIIIIIIKLISTIASLRPLTSDDPLSDSPLRCAPRDNHNNSSNTADASNNSNGTINHTNHTNKTTTTTNNNNHTQNNINAQISICARCGPRRRCRRSAPSGC